MKRIDLTGQQFGKLTVIRYDGTSNSRAYWLCRCGCGAETVVDSARLRSGNTKSCGCGKWSKSVENLKGAKKKTADLTGKRFGRLAVLERLPNEPRSPIKWLCLCDCGNKVEVRGDCLRYGRTKSCGCLAKEVQRKTGASSKGRPSKKMLDLTGQRFGGLVVRERDTSSTRYVKWHCVCDCGKTISASTAHLRSGHTISCGCLGLKHATEAKITHGGTKSSLYHVWNGMRMRCGNPKSTGFKWYGAKGVKVCEEWSDFAVFRAWAESHGYKQGLTIDRIDPDGNYCPSNCRWITRSENSARVIHKKKTHS